jgi:hypothetical protein
VPPLPRDIAVGYRAVAPWRMAHGLCAGPCGRVAATAWPAWPRTGWRAVPCAEIHWYGSPQPVDCIRWPEERRHTPIVGAVPCHGVHSRTGCGDVACGDGPGAWRRPVECSAAEVSATAWLWTVGRRRVGPHCQRRRNDIHSQALSSMHLVAQCSAARNVPLPYRSARVTCVDSRVITRGIAAHRLVVAIITQLLTTVEPSTFVMPPMPLSEVSGHATTITRQDAEELHDARQD